MAHSGYLNKTISRSRDWQKSSSPSWPMRCRPEPGGPLPHHDHSTCIWLRQFQLRAIKIC